MGCVMEGKQLRMEDKEMAGRPKERKGKGENSFKPQTAWFWKQSFVMSKSCTYSLTSQNMWGFVLFFFFITVPEAYVLVNECFSLLYY